MARYLDPSFLIFFLTWFATFNIARLFHTALSYIYIIVAPADKPTCHFPKSQMELEK